MKMSGQFNTQYQFCRRLDGPRVSLDPVEKKTLLALPGIEHSSSVVQPIAYHHTDLSFLTPHHL
jgi:hypothetical protein